jgi:hypothetical protein
MDLFHQLPPWLQHYRILPALGVPLFIALLGVFAKSLIQRHTEAHQGPHPSGKQDWSHLHMGMELSLAALTVALLNIGELLRPGLIPVADELRHFLLWNFPAALFSIVWWLYELSLHEQWGSQMFTRPRMSFFRLVVWGNSVGFVWLVFVALIPMK